MSQNGTDFEFDGAKRRAVELVAFDVLSDDEIAREVGRTRQTLARWKREPEFMAAVGVAIAENTAAIKAEGIANKQNRIDEAKARHDALKVIIGERGADEHIASFPGGSTGFIAPSLKLIKIIDESEETGPDVRYKEFWEHTFDSSLFAAFANLEKQIAQETGQWEEKIEQTVTLHREITVYQGETGARIEVES